MQTHRESGMKRTLRVSWLGLGADGSPNPMRMPRETGKNHEWRKGQR